MTPTKTFSRRSLWVGLAAAMAGLPAYADLDLRFVEGAPKDRFSVTNTGPCPLGPGTLTFDLSGAAGGLIFDTTGTGAGVEVFQPFVLVSGMEQVLGQPQVSDGDTRVALNLRGLEPGGTVAFTIDVDDTGGGREITVSGSEIAGAIARLDGVQKVSAAFDARARATLPMPACSS